MSKSVGQLCRMVKSSAVKLARIPDDPAVQNRQFIYAIEAEEQTPGTESSSQAIQQYVERLLPLQTYARELSLLGLAGRSFTAETYAQVLRNWLGLDVEILRPAANAGDAGNIGTTAYDIEGELVTIRVPLRLGWWLYQYTLHHELGHVAAGHPLPVRSPNNGTIESFKVPDRRLARQAPVAGPPTTTLSNDTRLLIYEAEAELRAKRGMLAGSLGPTVVQTGNLSQVQ